MHGIFSKKQKEHRYHQMMETGEKYEELFVFTEFQ